MLTDEVIDPGNSKPTEIRVYESIREVIEHGSGSEYLAPAQTKWVGRKFRGWDDAASAARTEWREGIERVSRLADQLRDEELPDLPVVRRRPAYSEDDGDEVCLERLRLGRPYWRTTRRQSQGGVRDHAVIVDVSTPSVVDPQKIFHRGAAGIVLAEMLERAGHRVEIWAADFQLDTYESKPGNSAIFAPLKRATDPIDVSTLANATSGWFYRTFWLGAVSRSHRGRRTKSCLGRPAPLTESLLRRATIFGAYTVIADCWDEEQSAQHVRRALRVFNRATERRPTHHP